MKKLKLGLQLSMAAAFATAIFLGFASFCSFTFTKGAQVQSFTLSAWEMIHGKTADFSAQVLGGSPFLGAMFFIIPLFGLIGCLISKPDVRASVTGVSALVGSVYIYFCNLLVPDAVYYSHALEEVFREHMNPDSVSFALTTSGNILWAVYLLAIICAAATFIVFMLDVKAEYTARKNAPEETVEIEGAIRLDEEEETAFDEIDELEPPQYEDEPEYEEQPEIFVGALELPEENDGLQEEPSDNQADVSLPAEEQPQEAETEKKTEDSTHEL